MARSEQEVNKYYEDLTEYINENSGLEAMSIETVKWVCRLSKKFVPTHESSDASRPQRAWSPQNPCSAKKTNGEPCRKAALNGSNVCRTHGGAAKQTVNAARIRLQNATNLMAQQLLRMAVDENVSDATKLKAITEALDRGGLAVKSTVDLDISVKPYESIFEQMSGGSRAAHRGEDQPRALVASDHDAIEAEIVVDDLADGFGSDLGYQAQPITPDGYKNPAAFDSAPSPYDCEPPPGGLLTMEDALASIAEQRRQSAEGHAQVHRAQKALPPGRSAS